MYIICIYYVYTSVIFDIMVCISKFMCFMVPDGTFCKKQKKAGHFSFPDMNELSLSPFSIDLVGSDIIIFLEVGRSKP